MLHLKNSHSRTPAYDLRLKSQSGFIPSLGTWVHSRYQNKGMQTEKSHSTHVHFFTFDYGKEKLKGFPMASITVQEVKPMLLSRNRASAQWVLSAPAAGRQKSGIKVSFSFST